MIKPIKLVWTTYGNFLALGVYAPTQKEAERIFNVCYNYGAVSIDAKFHLLKNDKNGVFGYFKTTWKDLTKVTGSTIAEFLPKTQKEIDNSREDFLTKINQINV